MVSRTMVVLLVIAAAIIVMACSVATGPGALDDAPYYYTPMPVPTPKAPTCEDCHDDRLAYADVR